MPTSERGGAAGPPVSARARETEEFDAGESGAAAGRLAAMVERLRGQVEAAHAAADGRALVELAKGILVERLGCGPAQAAKQLAELSDQAGMSVLELSVDIINQAARDRVAEVAAAFMRRCHDAGSAPGAPEPARSSPAVRLRSAESAALAAGGDSQTVAESLLRHALAPLGANAVAIWSVDRDGSLALSGHAGFGAEEAERWRHVPPGVTTVARQALTGRATVRLDSVAAVPSIGYRRFPDGGRIALCAGTGGRIHGVLEVCWPEPLVRQPPAVERQLEALAELCAFTLENLPDAESEVPGRAQPNVSAAELAAVADGLYDPALVLTPELDADGRLADFRIHHVNDRFQDPAGRPRSALDGALLLQTYPLAIGASVLSDHLARVYATGEPVRVERMAVTALADEVPLQVVADISVTRHGGSLLMIWRIEDETARLARLLQHAQRLGRIGGFEEDLETGEITWSSQLFTLYGRPAAQGPSSLRDLAAHAHPDDTTAIGRFLRTLLHHRRPATIAFRLNRADGVVRHIRIVAEPVLASDDRLVILRGAYQDVSSQHWTEVALAATRDRLEHSELEAAQSNRLTLQLQHAIMPPAGGPLQAPGLRVAVRYRPAESESMVGGDWYDTVVLPSGQVLLCVGDVAGHGVTAATGMVVLRNALRGLAMTGAGPGQLLSWLNSVAHHLSDRLTATAVCGLYDPATRRLRWARAGHLPPVVVSGPEAAALPLTEGTLLGAWPDRRYEEAEMQLQQRDILLMYTDGLVERRDTAWHISVDHLIATVRTPADSLGELLDTLLTYSRSDTDDDTCLIGVQITEPGAP
ncbi:GAF domain-containing SpoIIE family protein phosphatase [Actinospica robiniae]|uniref:SpoIIE family protein phosphatase n=1 Tax=Actinospica robiniae TaxID=304901 RepID=UPI001B7FDBFE|nr:GAF domain-containing SpoIIE family protein phosphatase [Actinospica robiniae]